MRPRALALLAGREIGEAVRSRWLAGFTAGFSLLALGLVAIGSRNAVLTGTLGFGRTTAALMNLVLLLVPLVALVAGSLAIAGERERGTLSFVLALPFDPREVFWSKVLGLGLALGAALGLVFAIVGGYLAAQGDSAEAGTFWRLAGATGLLAASALALGFLASTVTTRGARAAGAALLLWLVLVFGSDLGLMGAAAATALPPAGLLAAAWLNPLTLFRLVVVDGVASGMDVLGPAGQCAQDLLGDSLRPAVLAGLVAWTLLPLAVAATLFRRNPLGGPR